MDITKQAQIIIILGILQFILSLNISPKSIVPLIFLVILIATGINTYTVNCLVVGNCHTFSWIVVGASIISLLILVNSVHYINKYKSHKDQYLLIGKF
jgi:hypothetical protein